jgi:hypothetical protein
MGTQSRVIPCQEFPASHFHFPNVHHSVQNSLHVVPILRQIETPQPFTSRATFNMRDGTAKRRVQRFATDWTVRGSNPGGGEICCNRTDRPWGPLNLLYDGYWVNPGVKAAEAWS